MMSSLVPRPPPQLSSLAVRTSVDAKYHGASLSEQWNVTWVGNNSVCIHSITTLQIKTQTFIRLWARATNVSEQVEHLGVSNVAMFQGRSQLF